MEIIISWISLAYTLAEKEKTNLLKLEEAFEEYEKMKEKFREAKELIGCLSEKSDISEEDLLTAQTYCEYTITKLKMRQRNLFINSVDSCISSLKALYQRTKLGHFYHEAHETAKNLDEKIKETKLESHFAKAYPQIFSKLEKTLRRLKQIN